MRIYRKLLPAEGLLFHGHLARLSPDDRIARFSGGVSVAALAEHVRRFDWRTGWLIGCFDGAQLRGVAELRWLDPGLGWRAELAITVEEAWQDLGIGTELLRLSVIHARNRGLKSLYMICLTDNGRMQAIARKFEGELSFEGSQVEADIAVPFPTQFSLLAEALSDGMAFAHQWWAPLLKTDAAFLSKPVTK
jgi:RimJ/RimL family protein N-acetyltransferase